MNVYIYDVYMYECVYMKLPGVGRITFRLEITFFVCNRFAPYRSILRLYFRHCVPSKRTPGGGIAQKNAMIRFRPTAEKKNLFRVTGLQTRIYGDSK